MREELSQCFRKLNAGALAVGTLAAHEGLRLAAYLDPILVPTICYGETKGVRMGMTLTKDQCDEMFVRRVAEFERGVLSCAPGLATAPVPRLVAHVSLAYNIGVGGYCKSSVARLFNAGAVQASCDFFLKYNRAGGVVWRGLTKRREHERELCMRPS
jgi:lysozyme